MGKYQVLLTQKEYEQRVFQKWKDKIKVLGKYKGYYTSIKHYCYDCDIEFLKKPSHVLYGTYDGCPNCADRILKLRKTKEYKQRLKEKFNNNIKCLENYQGYNVPILHRCKTCKHEWKISPTFMMSRRNTGCSECTKKVVADIVVQAIHDSTLARYKKQEKEYIQRLNKVTNGNIKISKKDCFHGLYADTLHRCKTHNIEFLFKPINISSRTTHMWICPECVHEFQVPKLNGSFIKKQIKEKFPYIEVLLLNKSEYKSYFKCLNCNNTWESSFLNILATVVGCPACARKAAGKANAKTHKEYKKEIKDKYNNRYKVCDEYINDGTKIRHLCKKHNIEWLASPNSLLNGECVCPKCRKRRTRGYSKLADEWLEKRSELDNVKIRTHKSPKGEYKILLSDGTLVKVDGYARKTNTVYEFYGDSYHGNPLVYKADDHCNPYKTNLSAYELLRNTLHRESQIRLLGYNVITIWEYDYLRGAI